MSAAAWIGYCTGCARDGLEVASRSTHHQRVLCARCVATGSGRRREHLPLAPNADPRDEFECNAEGLVIGVGAATWGRWEAERLHAARRTQGRSARQHVVDALDGCGYIDADTVGARCPLCRGPLAVTFPGELVELRCCDGCDEADVTRAVLGEGVV